MSEGLNDGYLSNMKEFRYVDKVNNVAFRGIVPNNDKNCPPFLFFCLSHAYYLEKLFSDKVKASGLAPMPEYESRMFVLKQVDEKIESVLSSSPPNPKIHELLTNDTLNFKKQKRLLNGLKLSHSDILWLYKEAQDLGYLMDTTLVESHPAKFDENKKPFLFYKNLDGTMDVIGKTDMTEGEMRAYLEQRKVVQVRIFHNTKHWHCFYYTFKGMAGKEHGEMGGQPHYHYLSDKSGLSWEQLQMRIENVNMPSSDVHILVNNRWFK